MSRESEGKLLAELRKSRGLSQEALGQLLGKNQDWVSRREMGRLQIKASDRVKIANLLGVPETVLLGATQPSSGMPAMGLLTPGATGKIKVYGSVSAGQGNTSTIDPNEEEVPLELCRPDFGALRIEGDSMMDFLHPSDLAIFKDWKMEKLSHVVAAELPSGEWVTKLMVYEDGEFKLRSLNAKYADIEPPFRIAGFLVGFVRDDGPERLIRLNPYGLKP